MLPSRQSQINNRLLLGASKITDHDLTPLTQRAAVWHGRGDVRVQDWPLPAQPPAGWVRIEVAWCGLCGSDVAEFVGGPVVIPVETPAPGGRRAPLILGHEVSGTVVTVVAGSAGTTPQGTTSEGAALDAGERVVTDTLISCGHCPACRRGEVNLCPVLTVAGLSADGGLAEFVDVPVSSCVVLPADLDLDVAALAEPLAVALRAVRRAELGPEDQVVVIGLGAIGLLITMLLADRHVIGVDPAAARRQRARERTALECHESVADLEPDARRWVAFECTGNTNALNDLIGAAPAHSRLVLVGVHGPRTPTDLHRFLHSELDMVASLSHSRADMRAAVDRLARQPDFFRSVLTHKIILDDTPAVLESLSRADTPVVKALIGRGGQRWSAGPSGAMEPDKERS